MDIMKISGIKAVVFDLGDTLIPFGTRQFDRIWERLYRGDRSRSRQGLGLGLNYVKAVVEAHGGQILVTSKIREGSCFEVRLPLCEGKQSATLKVTDQRGMVGEADIRDGKV